MVPAFGHGILYFSVNFAYNKPDLERRYRFDRSSHVGEPARSGHGRLDAGGDGAGSILATAALGAAAFIHTGDTAMQFKAVIAPMLIAAVGILLSIIGIFAVRTKENAKMKDLLASLAFGTNLSSVLIVVATFFILWLLKLDNWMWISCAVIVGLVVGIIIGRSTEYYTSQSYRPTQKLSESGKTGPATVIICVTRFSVVGIYKKLSLIRCCVLQSVPQGTFVYCEQVY